MNLVPYYFWRSGRLTLNNNNRVGQRQKRRRRRLKTQVYLILFAGSFLVLSYIHQNWQWYELRQMYSAEEGLILYDGGGGVSTTARNKNENESLLSSGTKNQQEQAANATPNPHAKWNPTKIVSTIRDVKLSEKPENTDHNKAAAFLRGSRQSNHFSDFVQWNDNDDEDNYNSGMTYDQAKEGREPLLEILEGLGLAQLTTKELLQLPKWSQVQDLYGDKPILVGMDTCLKFQMKVPIGERYIGVAGSFNTGTTAFGLSLQQNCRFPNRKTASNEQQQQAAGNTNKNIVTNVHGMLNQVPWAKHKMAHERFDHTMDDTIPKENVLPVVLVRDPYYWMQSMCKQGYGVRWDHNSKKHCPNLVPNEFDLKRFAQKYAHQTNKSSSVPVWMGQSYQSGPHWDSLVHYWNDWYGSYYHNDAQKKNATDTSGSSTPPPNNNNEKFPRLMIRFEDTLFHAKTVMKMVCACGGGIFSGNEEEEEEEEVNIGFVHGKAKQGGGGAFRPIVDEAKFEHKHVQNNLISAIVKYGTDKTRYRNMTKDDLDFAQTYLDPELIQAFRYKLFQ